MKDIFKILIIVPFLFNCNDDFLERFPISEISPENSFNTAQELELYTNSFYNDLPGVSGIIESDNISDNVLFGGVPLEQTGGRVVPGTAGSSGWSWGDLRKINVFFENFERSTDEAAKKEYSGVAYFFRAWFYFEKIKRFGDVPWYDEVIGSTDVELLTKPRDSRELVINNIITDLDKAIENLNTDKSVDRVSRWTALALKSRVCLFEGTFRKYHNLSLPTSADNLLTLSYQAAERVINESPFGIYNTGNPNTDYRDLFSSFDVNETEVMLTRRYSQELNVINNINYFFTSQTQSDVGLTKSIVDSYLMTDGSAFTAQVGYETIGFDQEMNNRDNRLQQTVRAPGYIRTDGTGPLLPDFGASITGYQIAKFLTGTAQDGFRTSYQDVSIMRYAEVLLNFAEAKAELGILTQPDIDKSILLLRSRAGMSNLTLATANANPDPILAADYNNVSGPNTGVILEIRRERRVELALEGFRYDDLMRWKQGKLLVPHFKGMYFPSMGEFDLDGNGSVDVLLWEGTEPASSAAQKIELGEILKLTNGTEGNLVGFTDRTKDFQEDRDYLYPIPSGDILLNPELKQNPNW